MRVPKTRRVNPEVPHGRAFVWLRSDFDRVEPDGLYLPKAEGAEGTGLSRFGGRQAASVGPSAAFLPQLPAPGEANQSYD